MQAALQDAGIALEKRGEPLNTKCVPVSQEFPCFESGVQSRRKRWLRVRGVCLAPHMSHVNVA